MVGFSVGEKVVIRFADRQGEEAEITEIQAAQVYRLKMADGSSLFYSGLELARTKEELLTAVCELARVVC